MICLVESSTCFAQLCAHPQEDNFINTTSGIITLKTIEWSKISKIARIHRNLNFYADVVWDYLLDSTGFIIPDSCIVLVQFCFDILVFVYLFCFFEKYKILFMYRREGILNEINYGTNIIIISYDLNKSSNKMQQFHKFIT